MRRVVLVDVMRHEWRVLRADRTLWAIAGLVTILIGYGLYNGESWARAQQSTIEQARQEEARRFMQMNSRLQELTAGASPGNPFSDPRRPALVGDRLGGRYATLPPSPLAALAIGQSDLSPSYYRISLRNKEAILSGSEIENPLHLLVGRFDLAFVVVYLLPLVIFSLSFNMLSLEREQGTLAMVLCQPISLWSLLIGKTALRAGVLLLVVGIALVSILLTGVDLMDHGVLVRVALWIGLLLAYGAIWFTLAMLVNAAGQTSSTNFIILTVIWLAVVVILPWLVNLAVTSNHPVPSRIELIQTVREVSRADARERNHLLAQYYTDHPELVPAQDQPTPSDLLLRVFAVQQEVDRAIQPLFSRYQEQLDHQQQLVSRYRFLSPAIVMQEALNDIAGTGFARYRHFVSQIEQYHAEWKAFFLPKMFQRAALSLQDLAAVPTFRFQEASESAMVTRVLTGALWLVLVALAIGAGALLTLRRFSVTA